MARSPLRAAIRTLANVPRPEDCPPHLSIMTFFGGGPLPYVGDAALEQVV